MTSEPAIQAIHLNKKYKLYDKPIDRLKESLNIFGRKFHKEFHAINNVSFEVKKGEMLGIIGKNGSGKSTLLKMITGVLTPTSGKIHVSGNVSALLELGAGFNPELTGIENIYMNGTLMGYMKTQMDDKIEEILSFADIGDFIHQPIKIYSSGMFVRLAFAVAINVDPDILIVDEALSVGDIRFQQKCFRKINEFKAKKTILFVSHDMTVINKYCDRAIWINEGELIDEGSPADLSKKYQAFMMGSSLNKLSSLRSKDGTSSKNENTDSEINVDELDSSLDVLGDNRARIIGLSLIDTITEDKIVLVEPGQSVKLLIKVKANDTIEEPIVGFSIKDRLGNIIAQQNSYALNEEISTLLEGQTRIVSFKFSVPMLNRGQYSISPAIASGTQDEHTQHSWIHDALIFQVQSVQMHELSGIMILNDVEFDSIS